MPIRINIETVISILALLGIGGLLGALANHLLQKSRDKESRSITRKIEAYSDLLNFTKGFLGDPNLDYHESLKYQQNFLKKFHNDILLFASSDVIKATDIFLDSVSISHTNKDESTDAIFRLITAMRNDLGLDTGDEVSKRYKMYAVNLDDLRKKKGNPPT